MGKTFLYKDFLWYFITTSRQIKAVHQRELHHIN